MKLNINIDEKHGETSVTIQATEWTEELEEIVKVIKKKNQQRLFGMDEDQTVLLDPSEIDYICAENRKIYAVLKDRRLELKMKLYEVEDMLIPHHFMRFSKSVIGNLHLIERFDLSFNGNLCVYFKSGNKEYITRKYVNPIKEKLLMGGNADDR
jgi:DNA-binding LytR/AlgR family response regulator